MLSWASASPGGDGQTLSTQYILEFHLSANAQIIAQRKRSLCVRVLCFVRAQTLLGLCPTSTQGNKVTILW